MGHGGKVKRVRDCSVLRGWVGAVAIYDLSFPKYNEPLAYSIFLPSPPPLEPFYFLDDPVNLKFHLFFDTM